jgi:hypothetical protein
MVAKMFCNASITCRKSINNQYGVGAKALFYDILKLVVNKPVRTPRMLIVCYISNTIIENMKGDYMLF